MRDTSLVLHKPSRFISELPPPETADDGTSSGLYEQWVLELVAPEALPPTPGDSAPRLNRSNDDDDANDDAIDRYRMEN
jgi:hypothetical protein